jgi:uncharacterized BrkB/YihY/UPF0761 family membrane protein
MRPGLPLESLGQCGWWLLLFSLLGWVVLLFGAELRARVNNLLKKDIPS